MQPNDDMPDRALSEAPQPRRVSRRAVLRGGAGVALSASTFSALLVACTDDGGERDMMDGMRREMPDWMMSSGSMAQMMEAMLIIRNLLIHHEQIQRHVEDIPAGIRSITTSEDPEVAEWIRTHVSQMQERVESGNPIRQMDPLFREIFRHHQEIVMHAEDVPGGTRVRETSENPQVQLLIRQHAHRAVSEFVAFGMERAMQPTPLPEGYRETDGG